MLRLGSGKSGSCSRLETKTEPAKMRLESDFRGRLIEMKWFCFTSVLVKIRHKLAIVTISSAVCNN